MFDDVCLTTPPPGQHHPSDGATVRAIETLKETKNAATCRLELQRNSASGVQGDAVRMLFGL